MLPLSLSEVAAATGGRLTAPVAQGSVVSGPVVVDSRRVAPGSLFVAVSGEHVDGHDFAAGAVASGAVAALTTREVEGVPCVVVSDVVEALGALATAVLGRLPDVEVSAITGSSGKTSTKDLLAQVLSRLGPTVAPPGSFNTEIGLPLTVLSCDTNTRHLVLEMGARGLGHIAYLCRIARPYRSTVLNVGSAHVGEFGSRAAIAQTKGEILEALPAEGLAVLNDDDEYVREMAPRTSARVVRVGLTSRADVRAADVATDGDGRASFVLEAAGERHPVQLQLHGEHHVSNALAVAAFALDAGMSPADVAVALSQARAQSAHRMDVRRRQDGLVVIDDAYNANPESMRAALKALVAIGEGRRTWAVLGEMRELGEAAVAEHDAVGRLAVRLNVAKVVAVGEGARPLHLGASLEGSWDNESVWVPDVDEAIALLREQVEPGDVVLVKASNAVALWRVADALTVEVPA
ncbi:MAG: UDP-N-acetylmuramoyl-tripeptide--D-alanyl-D-alanine ligase [Actinomycetes bacterium]